MVFEMRHETPGDKKRPRGLGAARKWLRLINATTMIIMLLFAACGGGKKAAETPELLQSAGDTEVSASDDDAYPVKYTEKVDSTPDLMQTDAELDLLEGGQMSCGSVSITNSLAWLANNGFEEVMLRDADGNVSYAKTAQAMDRVLNLTRARGALPPAFLRGVSRYLTEQGYTDADYRLEFQGWCRSKNLDGVDVPSIDALKRGLIGGSAVWLFVGFYRYDGQGDEYQIISHHYVTLVGYGVDEHGNEDPDVLIVHDPAPRSGSGVSHDYVRIERLNSGRITVDPTAWFAKAYSQLPIDAAGYHKLGDGLAYNPKADVAILDGVIILRMNE